MGKITLLNYQGKTKIKLPKELIFLFKQSRSKRIKASLTYNVSSNVLDLMITDIDWGGLSDFLGNIWTGVTEIKKVNVILDSSINLHIRSNNIYHDSSFEAISFCVKKGKGLTICEKIDLDYNVYQNSDGKILIKSSINLSELTVNRYESTVRSRKYDLYHEIYRMIPSVTNADFFNYLNNVNEIYYYENIVGNNIRYITKDKFAYAIHNNISLATESLYRNMGIGKFFKDHLPHIPEATINAFIEYNKMLTSYDASLFSIVSGDDIVKYYNQNTYFKMTGELGSSCMRDSGKSSVISFYAKNSNFRLLIMKAGQTDNIMGRALLVTTTDGTVFMDRVYTVDTKLINAFHTYARENFIENIYEYRQWSGGDEKNLFRQSPSNWTKTYDENYKVDLDWIPEVFTKNNKGEQYRAALLQHSNITSNFSLPYIDNFQYINPFTMQASVNALDEFTTCDLSGNTVKNEHAYFSTGKVYDTRFVNTLSMTLIEDVVKLDEFIPEEEVDTEQDSEEQLDEELEVSESEPAEIGHTITAERSIIAGESGPGLMNQMHHIINIEPTMIDRGQLLRYLNDVEMPNRSLSELVDRYYDGSAITAIEAIFNSETQQPEQNTL
jgi:hypothetical protein